jgi:ABC-2 type transport system ATP-binding protein
MTKDIAIRLIELGKNFGKQFTAVDNVSFEVPAGEIFGFMGHNGAGKTTTIHMLLGLLTPSHGRAEVLGRDVQRDSLAIRALAGFLPADFTLPKDMTPRRFLRYIGALFGMRGKPLENRIDELLERFELSEVAEKKLRKFSTGMSQKVGLAQALINNPRVLILDEPTSGLDPIGRHELLEVMKRLAADEGVTVLFSTHILSDVERVCRSVAILHRGCLVATGEVADLKAQHGVDHIDDLYLALAQSAA